mmetsp:Transcript_41761/g.79950  ORF Transcript_41761/g.79950 Transcript_41761/m.79950 type:complete len:328 (-) Transcript_41761:56-1039(-)
MPDVKPDPHVQPLKFLPILYVLFTVLGMWAIYMLCHCLPRIQLGVPEHAVDFAVRKHAYIECASFNVVTVLLLASYVMCILTHPGEIPLNDPNWEYSATPDPGQNIVKEKKKSGDRRHCKWCGKYKPDRCHHCRTCRICILKMDHHCPWIYNCVGFHNYKYFFLVTMYAAIACQIISITMWDSVYKSVDDRSPFFPMFCLVFGQTLAFFLSVMLSTFWAFHFYLMCSAMTTIEFCEKNLPKQITENEGCDAPMDSAYNQGTYLNICQVMGYNPLLWLLPVPTTPGNGLAYLDESSPLLASDKLQPDLEATRKAPRSAMKGSRRGNRC